MESDFIISTNLRECDYGSEEWKEAKGYISKSGLTKIKESPDHYKNGEPFIETPEVIFGRMYHCFVFQPNKFKQDYYVFDEQVAIDAMVARANAEGQEIKKPRATKEYKEWFEGQMQLAEGKIMITREDYDKLKAMKDKLLKHPYANMLISKGIPEKGILGELETQAGKIGIKLIPDLRNDNKRVCVELKTTARGSKKDFPREAANYDYHIQAALYSDILELFYGDNRPVRFIFIAQEKRKPYAFNIFEASPQFIAQGRYEYEMLMQLYKYCLDNNYWPGYQVFCPNKYGILELSLPPWSVQSMDYFIYKTKNNGKSKTTINQ